MLYNGNKSIRNAIKAAAALEGLTLAAVASRLDKPPQAINNTLLKQHITFDDVQTIAAALGYRLHFELIKEPCADQLSTSAPGQQPGL